MKTWKVAMLCEDGTEAVETVEAPDKGAAEAEAMRRRGGLDKVALPIAEEMLI